MKKIIYFVLIAVCLWMSGCEATTINLKDWQIGFSIDSISFGGDWTAHKTNGVDTLKINVNLDHTSDHDIKLRLPITYTDNNPSVLVTNDKYVLDGKGDWRDSSKLIVKSEFKRSMNMDLSADLDTLETKTLKNEYYYKLNLKYDRDINSVLNIEIKDKKWNLVPKGFNFKVNYEVVHDTTADGGRLNLIVMAEGYRADHMDDYRAYVA
ncbi:MAG: hypothetical protein J6W76_06950, partial [Spirochaetales bacterium]|nr:hypothetical protein [Spirochaetales bacterium]